MILCPNCKSQEPDGTIFCSECGAQLSPPGSSQTQKFAQSDEELQSAAQYAEGMSSPNNNWVSLHLLDSGKILGYSDRTEITLGRLSENQPVEPDVDLSPYNAFDYGVSRLHAVIRRADGKITILDLGSSNGTYVNGIRLNPNTEHQLRHGDIVALGKLKMQVVLS